ncbi:MAG: restriction endonuclease subunit S [Pseudomonas sp.]|nr:restriction endonuclease subunit S [Pseudomonas sp.]
MTALLTDNLPLLAGAPNGIKKLRELILELAVRGKLVPQDPSDEPASELLKRIAEKMARLVVDGSTKKQKQLPGITQDETPFDVPAGWCWVRMGAVGETNIGLTYSPSDVGDIGIPVLRSSNVQKGQIDLSDLVRVDMSVKGSALVQEGDLLICARNGSKALVGKTAMISSLTEPMAFGAFMAIFRSQLNPYLLRFINSPLFRKFIDDVNTTTINQITQNNLRTTLLPLPPLAEQHRIVAKVDELMALCDHLEAQQADAECAHAQLVQALLDSLTRASDANEFAANWQRLAEHFHTLFTNEPSIDALKQTLLQLAVMGKLVPQDPSDEPADKLIERISKERAKLVATGQLKKQKQLEHVTNDEKYFPPPNGWVWTRFGTTIQSLNNGLYKPAGFYTDSGVISLRMYNIQDGAIVFTDARRVNIDEKEIEQYRLQAGDLLVNRVNSKDLVGKTAVIPETNELLVYESMNMRARPFAGLVNSPYLNLFMRTRLAKDTLLSHAKEAIGQASLNQGQISSLPLPFPPLNEQHRIVAKVDQLMALCDQLKTRLTQARQLNEQLASTLVERALTKDEQPARVTTDQKAARSLLAAEITHQLHGQRTFGQRKLQKVIYLAEHAARLAAVQGNYLRDAAGPHDRQLINQVENELFNRQWYECIDRETFGHAYRPLAQAGQHRQAYASAWSTAERATIERVINLMRDWDTDRCEMTVTLYAAWNDFILEGRPVTDEAIVDEVMHSWNDAKLRFDKGEWLAVLTEMKKHELLIPTGFGQRTIGGMLTLPGV